MEGHSAANHIILKPEGCSGDTLNDNILSGPGWMTISSTLKDKNSFRNLYSLTLLAVICWIGVVSFSWYNTLSTEKRQLETLAIDRARAYFNKDQAIRAWTASHGGLYVPVSPKNPPNPYLAHIEERDVTTPSGKKLTLMNPAYMLRQVMSQYEKLYGVKGHITSNKPINPLNIPDAWERQALQEFEQGSTEKIEFTTIDDEKFLRLMRPMKTSTGCLKCHTQQGYGEGDIRGGVSIALPLQFLAKTDSEIVAKMTFSHTAFGLGGLVVILSLGFMGKKRILAREKAFHTLWLKEERYREFIEGTDNLIIQMNCKGHLTFMNHAARQILGFSASDSDSLSIYDLIHPDDRTATFRILQEAIDANLIHATLENRLVSATGDTHHIHWTTNFHYSHKGDVLRINAIGRDINDLKKAESKLKLYQERLESKVAERTIQLSQSNTSLQQSLENANRLKQDLEKNHQQLRQIHEELKAAQSQMLQREKMASIGQLAAGIAHEINNPVGFVSCNLGSLAKYFQTLKQFTEQLEKNITPAHQEEISAMKNRLKLDFILRDCHDLINESLSGVERINHIVMGLKNFSRIDNPKESLADLNECLEDTLTIIWNELKYKASVTKNYGRIPMTQCFPQQLNQVFMNLLINASQAIEEKGDITISTWFEHNFIHIAIADTGCGIAPDTRHRIFEPFFTTKDVGKGTGLGLSISYDIVRKHGGEILVEDNKDAGTVFTIKLPYKS